MCNGETANNTINTCNGNDCSHYLETHGQNGRILIDQPGLWTENEGGFQTWGGAPPPGKEPYFWGRSIEDQSMSVMKWFARGGSHMNYYMWTGGNNYGRWTGDAITHMYAVDAIVCPDGFPHEPKYSHTTAMHGAIASVAQEIASAPAATTPTSIGEGASAYVYGDVAFLESGAGKTTATFKGHSYTIPPRSSSLVRLSTGKVLFNSATIGAPSKEHRELKPIALSGHWAEWAEPLMSSQLKPADYPAASLFENAEPMEMTNLTHALTTFAFYEAAVTAEQATMLARSGEGAAMVSVKSFEAMGLVGFNNGKLIGTAHEITHGNGASKTLVLGGPDNSTDTDSDSAITSAGGANVLTILAEELGYANYGFKTQLFKGIAPGPNSVHIGLKAVAGPWKMRGGLAGEHLKIMDPAAATSPVRAGRAQPVMRNDLCGLVFGKYECLKFPVFGCAQVAWTPVSAGAGSPATWYKTEFATPAGVSDSGTGSQLLLDAKGLGRGRIWLNGHEIGRCEPASTFRSPPSPVIREFLF